jgi:hypothetical protein
MTRQDRSDVTPYHRAMPINVESMLRAHSYMRTHRPPDSWNLEADDQTFFGLLGEMIVAGMHRGNDLGDLTLSVTNVTVLPGTEGPIPTGDHVAVTVSGAGDWTPERTWDPTAGASPPPFVTDDLEAAARGSDAVYGYTRQTSPEAGGITLLFPAALEPGDEPS